MGDHFAAHNANKRAITLDLTHPEGVANAQRLAEGVDVVTENFRPSVMPRLCLGYAELSARNPRLVMVSMSGFGAEGPLAERPMYDNVVQAFSGLMAMTGTAESGPLKAGAPVLDYASGAMAAFAVTTALLRRERSGLGQHITLSMLDVAFMLMGTPIASLLNAGQAPRLHANEHALAGASCYRAADGEQIMLGACTQRQFDTLCRRIGRPDLLEDPRFADVRRQDPHRAALAAIFAAEMSRRPAWEWEAILADAVPAARVRNLAEALADSDAAGRGVIGNVPWPSTSGSIAIPLAAFRADVDGPALDHAPPGHDQHTDHVLGELGLGAAEIMRLRASGVIGAAASSHPKESSS